MAPRRLQIYVAACCASFLVACGGRPADAPSGVAHSMEIVELRPGTGAALAAGQGAVVQYTGWLYEATAPDTKGRQFDSSSNTGQPFRFTVGAGQVIKGWDQGVVGMKVGEAADSPYPRSSPTAIAEPAARYHRARRWCSTWNSSVSNDGRNGCARAPLD